MPESQTTDSGSDLGVDREQTAARLEPRADFGLAEAQQQVPSQS